MPEKALGFFTANPFHRGHLALIESTLTKVDRVDICIGGKQKPWLLPHHVRVEAAQAALREAKLDTLVNIIIIKHRIRGSIQSIGPEGYSLLTMGSDMANQFDNSHPKPFRDYEALHFLSFPGIFILEREGHELSRAARSIIERRVRQLIVHSSINRISATSIRKKIKGGGNVQDDLPQCVWEIIKPHIEIFNNQT